MGSEIKDQSFKLAHYSYIRAQCHGRIISLQDLYRYLYMYI